MKRVETNLVFKEEKETSREIFTKEKEKETYRDEKRYTYTMREKERERERYNDKERNTLIGSRKAQYS